MQSSLDTLVENLQEFPETVKYVREYESGRIRGDEFQEILENLPTDLDDLGDGEAVDR